MKIPICLYIYVYFVFTPIRFILNLQHIYKLTHTAYFERHWKRCSKKYYDTLPIFNIHTGFALTLFELGSVGKQIGMFCSVTQSFWTQCFLIKPICRIENKVQNISFELINSKGLWQILLYCNWGSLTNWNIQWHVLRNRSFEEVFYDYPFRSLEDRM